MVTRGNSWMQTHSGVSFDLLSPSVDAIRPVDIAHSLAMQCRYNGHVSHFYSVAEHCVLMSGAVSPENALWALLHDATEAYVGDIIRPLKQFLPQYRVIEGQVEDVIIDKFSLERPKPIEITRADVSILHNERSALIPRPYVMPWTILDGIEPLDVTIHAWSPQVARDMFMQRLNELWSGDIE